MSNDTNASVMLAKAKEWWSTKIIDIKPGEIRIKGEPIQELIGRTSYAAMVWRMLRDDTPDERQIALLDAALVAAVDHGPHAPSIAIARMATTCGLPLNGAMASAVNTLDDVHGGAGEQCLELYIRLLEGAGENLDESLAGDTLTQYIAEHGKMIPGFGHRFHPVDPRAVKLLALVREAAGQGAVSGRFLRAGMMLENLLEQRSSRRVPMNIDGATAVVFGELGFAPPLARGLFILSRSVGILAHAWEQRQQGGRIKGPMPPSIPYSYIGR